MLANIVENNVFCLIIKRRIEIKINLLLLKLETTCLQLKNLPFKTMSFQVVHFNVRLQNISPIPNSTRKKTKQRTQKSFKAKLVKRRLSFSD